MTKNNVKRKSKLFLCAKPGHEKVLTLQKPIRILNKKIHNINSQKFYKTTPNFIKFE